MGKRWMDRPWWPAALVAAAIAWGCGGSDGDDAPPASASFRSAGLVVGAPEVSAAASGTQTVKVAVLGRGGARTIATAALPAADAASVAARLVRGNLVDWVPAPGAPDQAVVQPTAADTFGVVLSKGSSSAAQFKVARYGIDVTRNNGVPGPMVAAGWVYAKAPGSITIGDGRLVTADMAGRPYATPIKRYEETYAVASDVAVFNVDTSDYAKSAVSDFASIPVTADYAYATTSRQAVYVLFDGNYESAATAKVVAIWYFTPKSVADGKPVWDVPTQSPLLADKGTDPVSGQPYVAINATGVTQAPYTRSTEPFEMVKGVLWYVGDNEVSSYILKADMGTADPADDKLIKIDGGWPNSGYQYWKNMELMGLDPRAVTDVWLTHGHGDHYGTIVEQLRMMDNAGKPIKLWGSREDVTGIARDLQGNTFNVAGALPASETVIRARTTDFYTYDQVYDYGNVRIKVIWSPGHTPGTTNMIFEVKNPADGRFLSFGYHGGYGVNGLTTPTAANGFLRLSFQHGFSYLQQTQSVDYVAPQHGNQFPIIEVFQALKAYNRDPANANAQLTMLDAMRPKVFDSPTVAGTQLTSEFHNQLEKRRSVISYRASDANNASYKSLETSGPFKPGREAGYASIAATLEDGGRIVQGFVGPQNKNPRIPLLANGIVTATDTYVNDPGGYYVQVAVTVADGYRGFLPEGFTQFSPGVNQTIVYRGGPVETTHAARTEYLRTQRLASLADAQRVLASIGSRRAVTIGLTPASEIVVPADVTQTFR
jgi:hypothetical protein